MSQLMKAADECRKLLRGFQAFEEVASALERVGSIEQAQKEAEKAIASLNKQIADAKDDLVRIQAENAEAKAKAKVDIEKRLEEASAEALDIVFKAKAEAKNVIEDAQLKINQAQTDVEKLRAEASALEVRKQTAQTEFDAISANLEKVKAQAAKLLGD